MAFVNPRQKHRNTTAGLATKYGREGEICVDTEKKTTVVMDGTTQGGFPLAREDLSNIPEPSNDDYIPMDVGTVTPNSTMPEDNESHGLFGWIKKIVANLRYRAGDGNIATCSTAALTAAKELTMSELDITAGVRIEVNFTNGNAVTGDYLQVSFDTDATDDYNMYTTTVIGSPTYTNGKFNSNGATGLGYNIPSLASGSWCIQGKFKSTNTTILQTYIDGGIDGSIDGSINYKLMLRKNTGNRLQIYLSSNDSSWDIADGVTGTKSDWATDTEYYVRLRFDGSNYYVDWSLDGSSWTNDITIASALTIYFNIYKIFFGVRSESLLPLIGTMDDLRVSVGTDTITDTRLTLKANSTATNDLIKNESGKQVTGLSPAYFPSGANITFYRDATNTYWIYKNIIVDNQQVGTKWYNIYSNGFVRQGGYISSPGSGGNSIALNDRINLQIPMLNKFYYASVTSRADSTFYFDHIDNNRTTESVLEIVMKNPTTAVHSYVGYTFLVEGYAIV